MRVLIADKLPTPAVDDLRAAGCEVLIDPSLKGDTLTAAVAEHRAHVLIVRSTKVPRETLSAGPLGLVVRAGAGFNTIDVEAASGMGIYVANCPGKNSLAVAELAIGLLLSIDRGIPDAVAELRGGLWNKKRYAGASGLAGRTLGIVGPGRIGLAVAARAQALQMKVLAWTPFPAEAARLPALGIEAYEDLLAMARRCDALSVHVAASPETQGLIGAELLAALPVGAIVLNTSRAEVVDEEALLDACRERGIRAGLDVFSGEPTGGKGEIRHALIDEPGVYMTPHVGASTAQAQEAVAAEAVRVVRSYLSCGAVPNVVNITARSPASHLLSVRHLNRVGVLSTVFAHLKAAGINAAETENIVFSGGSACIARIHMDSAPSEQTMAAICAACADILDLGLTALGSHT